MIYNFFNKIQVSNLSSDVQDRPDFVPIIQPTTPGYSSNPDQRDIFTTSTKKPAAGKLMVCLVLEGFMDNAPP